VVKFFIVTKRREKMENNTKKIKTVLFDLDGTLLPMDQDVFIKAYFGGLARKLAPYGYETDALIKAIWQGTAMMVKNDGSVLNEVRFWDAFSEIYGEKAREDEKILANFYENEFDLVQNSCGYDKRAREVVDFLKEKGIKTVLATNPIFPPIATEKRVKWAGLDKSDFSFVTNYSNSHYCKPNPNYYKEIFEKLDLDPTECLMVGNDVGEDMVAKTLGASVFLLTPCLINKKNEDISAYPNGDFDDLISYLKRLFN
jgi:HAD superfamily hydrolase (TIGR01549 family)